MIINKKLKLVALTTALLLATGCTRIETGEVGLRVNFDKTIAPQELLSGTFNQTVIGSVLKFPIKELAVNIENKTPLTLDNTTLDDFDLNLVYSINQDSVSDLWGSKSRAFHNSDGLEIYLMQNYLSTMTTNAVFKVVRQYKALELADNRAKIENEIRATLVETLTQEKLQSSINISLVQIKNITLNRAIIDSANAVVTAQNALKTKEIEVKTAEQEALRISALNSNVKAIEYMNAQAQMKIAEGVSNGKVQTVVIPYDFKGMVSVGK